MVLMITGIDHIAIAVSSLPQSIERFYKDFQLDFYGIEVVKSAMTSTAFFSISEINLELVHPLNGGGPLAKYLKKKGGGLHHIAFRSDNIFADIDRLKAMGYEFLSEVPQCGAHGSKIIFIHPKSCDGVLIEICQPSKFTNEQENNIPTSDHF